MKLAITVLPGDGIGPEVTEAAVRVLAAVGRLYGHEFVFREALIGGAAIRAHGNPLPPDTRALCIAADAVLLGAVGGPEFDHGPRERRPEAGLLGLRQALGAFANLRPVACHRALAECSPLRADLAAGADVLIVRELLGGLYFSEPRANDGHAAFNTMRYTVPEIERIAHIGFAQARARRRKVTSVDKANVLETSQLWRQVVTRVATDYPEVTLEHMLVDSCAMRLVTAPTSFDVILTENLFGDILSDEAAVMAGSLGMLASASVGGRVDLYEPIHGSAPDIAGRGIANPLGAIGSAALLLRHTAKLADEASAIERAIGKVLDAGHRTADLCRGTAAKPVGTAEMAAHVERALAQTAAEGLS